MRFEYYPNYEIKKTLVYTLASGLKLEENKNSEKKKLSFARLLPLSLKSAYQIEKPF